MKQCVASFDGRLEIFYLPAYSPELNPVEQLRNHTKNNGTGRPFRSIHVKWLPLKQIFSRSDIVVICCARDEASSGLIDTGVLGRLCRNFTLHGKTWRSGLRKGPAGRWISVETLYTIFDLSINALILLFRMPAIPTFN